MVGIEWRPGWGQCLGWDDGQDGGNGWDGDEEKRTETKVGRRRSSFQKSFLAQFES